MSKISRSMRRFAKTDDGNVAIIFALALIPLVGAVGLAIDVGSWTSQKASLTKAADAASLAGVRELANAVAGEDDRALARAKSSAVSYLKANGFDGSGYTISPVIAEPLTVTVQLAEAAKKYFSPVVYREAHNIGAVSEAIALKAPDVCILALDPNASVGIDFNLSGEVIANKCSIWSNAQSNKSISANGSGHVNSALTCGVGGATIGGGIHLQPSVKTGCLPAKDPLAHWHPPAYIGACSNNNLSLEKPGRYTLAPGVYCGGIRIRGGATVAMQPGLYIFKDGPLSITGGGALTGDGVSMLFTGNKAVADFGGASVVDLSAPNSGPMAGLVLAAGRDQPQQTSTLKGANTFRLEGHVYLPTHDLKYSGGPEGVLPAEYTTVVARTIRFDGSTRVEFRKNTSGGPSYAAKAISGVQLTR